MLASGCQQDRKWFEHSIEPADLRVLTHSAQQLLQHDARDSHRFIALNKISQRPDGRMLVRRRAPMEGLGKDRGIEDDHRARRARLYLQAGSKAIVPNALSARFRRRRCTYSASASFTVARLVRCPPARSAFANNWSSIARLVGMDPRNSHKGSHIIAQGSTAPVVDRDRARLVADADDAHAHG